MLTAAVSTCYPRFSLRRNHGLHLSVCVWTERQRKNIWKYRKISNQRILPTSARVLWLCLQPESCGWGGEKQVRKSKIKMTQILMYIYNHRFRFSTLSSFDQRFVRMSKKDGVISHGVSTGNLSHWVDSLRVHGEPFQFRRARTLSTKSKRDTKIEYYTC